jgi:hypothetical protein
MSFSLLAGAGIILIAIQLGILEKEKRKGIGL